MKRVHIILSYSNMHTETLEAVWLVFILLPQQTSTYHISLLVADSVVEALRRHPLDWDSGPMLLAVIVRLVDVSGQTKVRNPHTEILVNPTEN